MAIISFSQWWGPPRKFQPAVDERKISWLELFYDLVYAIVIARTTAHLARHPDITSLLDYTFLMGMIFWGWLNGSLYYDLHGAPGMRTRLMTLWQMLAVAALAVTLSGPSALLVYRATFALVVLQAFITYLWWSVGLYDHHHRQLNRPFTFCYLGALALILLSMAAPAGWQRLCGAGTLLLNYLPPFLVAWRRREFDHTFSLSASMVERLGLLTIIVFGEAIVGVVNGITDLPQLTPVAWGCFGLGILLVFVLWLIFFALLADRPGRPGLLRGQLLALLYLPALAALGMIGAGLPGLLAGLVPTGAGPGLARPLFGSSLTLFLVSLAAISTQIAYPANLQPAVRRIRGLLLGVGVVALALTLGAAALPLPGYLAALLALLLLTLLLLFSLGAQAQVPARALPGGPAEA